MPQSSLSGVSNFSSNVLTGNIVVASNLLIDKIREKENDINIKLQSRQQAVKFESGITLTNYSHPTIIDNGVSKQPILYNLEENQYMYIFSNVSSNSSIKFPQNTKSSVLIVGGGGAGAPDIGGGGAGGNIIFAENIQLPANTTFPIIVGKGGSSSNVEDGGDSVAFGAVAKGGKAGSSLVIANDGTIDQGGTGGIVYNVEIQNNNVFKTGQYTTGLTNSIEREPAAVEFSFYNDTTDMLAWYKFDGDENLMLLDSSGNNRHLQYNINSTRMFFSKKSKIGSGCLYTQWDYADGNSYLYYSTSNNGERDLFVKYNEYTFSYWIKKNESGQPPTNCVFSKDSAHWYSDESTVGTSEFFYNGFGINRQYYSNGYTLNTNDWVHVTTVFKTENKNISVAKLYTVYFYYNGVFYNSKSGVRSSTITNIYKIGNNEVGYGAPLNAYLDDFRIYKRALTQDEITVIYELAGPTKSFIDNSVLLNSNYTFKHNYIDPNTRISSNIIYNNNIENNNIDINNIPNSVTGFNESIRFQKGNGYIELFNESSIFDKANINYNFWMYMSSNFDINGNTIFSTKNYNSNLNEYCGFEIKGYYSNTKNNIDIISYSIGDAAPNGFTSNTTTLYPYISSTIQDIGLNVWNNININYYVNGNKRYTYAYLNNILKVNNELHGSNYIQPNTTYGLIGGSYSFNEEYEYVEFTSSNLNSIIFNNDTICDVLLIGGGGGGGSAQNGQRVACGGGGAGACIYLKNQLFKLGSYNIYVGNGGAGETNGQDTYIIDNSSNILYKAIGGGAGSSQGNGWAGNQGGSSGGSAYGVQSISPNSSNIPFGIYGNSGNIGSSSSSVGGGGGGSIYGNTGVKGGNGIIIDITGTKKVYAAGGGGGMDSVYTSVKSSGGGAYINGVFVEVGGKGGLGWGDNIAVQKGENGLANTGSGGGGGGKNFWNNQIAKSPGSGGSGIVIIKWKKQSSQPVVQNSTIKTTNYNVTSILQNNFLLNDFRIFETFNYNLLNEINNTDVKFVNSTSNMIAWYKFINNFNDSSGNNKNLSQSFFSNILSNKLSNSDSILGNTNYKDFTYVNDDKLYYDSFYNFGLDEYLSFSIWVHISRFYDESVPNTQGVPWVKYNDSRFGNIIFSAKPSNATNDNNNIYVQANTQEHNGLCIHVYNDGTYTKYFTTKKFTLRKWTHVVLVFIKTNKILKVYIDGELVETVTNFNYPKNVNSNYNFYIGVLPTGTGYLFGSVDDFRIYNRELNAREIYFLYNVKYNGLSYNFIHDNTYMPIYYKFDNYDFLKNHGNSLSQHDLITVGVTEQKSINDSAVINGTASIISTNKDHVKFSNDWNYSNYEKCTICFWMRKTVLNTNGWDTIFYDSSQQSYDAILSRNGTNSSWKVSFAGGNWTTTGTNNTNINDWIDSDLNTWHHYCFNFMKQDDNGIMRTKLVIFKDNVESFNQVDLSSIWTVGTASQPGLISKNNINYQYYFYGYLDEFRIYNKNLNNHELELLYNFKNTATTSSGGGSSSIIYYASGGSGAGSDAIIVNDTSYGDGGSGVQTSIIVPKTYGQGGGGGSTYSYGYAGGKGTGKNSTSAAADGAPNTGAGGGGGKLDSLGGSGGSGLVAVLWTKADTMQINQDADANMSNYVSQIKQQLETSIESSSNQLVNVLNTDLLSINNYINETSNEVYNRLDNISTDTIITSINSSNKFIVNNIWNDNLVVSGTLYASNLSVVGSNIIVYTNAYTTENLSVITGTGAESVDGLTITHTGEGLHNILTATVADSPAMVITKDGYVGIGKTDPTSPLDIVGDLKITGNILPTVDQVYDLGSPATKWRDLYLSGNSIYLGENTRISSDTETGGIAIQDGAGNLKELSASAYKIRDPETSQVYSMKLGADKKIKFVTVDETNPDAVEEEVGTAADVWSSNAGYISYGNVKIYDSSSSVIMSVGDNVKIYDGSITILNNSIEQKLITESSTSLISFYGADAISSETTNNILDITKVPYKKSGRNANRYYKVFDISIISSANNLLFSSTLFRTYTRSSSTSSYSPDGVDNQLKFSYYSTNNVTSSHNGDGIMFKDNDIWFETVNGIEYMKSSMANNNVLSVTSR